MSVTVAGPVVAELLAVRVRVLGEQALQVLAGLNDAVTPAGRPEARKATLPPNPFSPFAAIVLVTLLPWVTVRLEGEARIVKFGWEPELLPQPASPRVTKRRTKAAASLRLLLANSLYPHLRRMRPLQQLS